MKYILTNENCLIWQTSQSEKVSLCVVCYRCYHAKQTPEFCWVAARVTLGLWTILGPLGYRIKSCFRQKFCQTKRNLLMHFGQISLDNWKAHSSLYINTQTRNAQNNDMFYYFLIDSLNAEFKTTILLYAKNYTIN